MCLSAIVAGGAALGSALIGSKASKKAAKAQEKSAQAGIDFQKYMYDTTRSDFAPWRAAGGSAITAGGAMLQPGYDHTTSPGYQFRMDEGNRAIQGSAAAKGGLLTGGTLKDILRYSQGVAADDFNDQFNRQMAVAAGGQQANTTTGQLGANAANNVSSLMTQQGNARASGYMGQANAWTGALQNLGGIMAGMGGGGGSTQGFTPYNLGGGIY